MWYASYYLSDVVAAKYDLDQNVPQEINADVYQKLHGQKIYDMIMSNEKHQFFKEGENYFVSGETYASQNLCKSILLQCESRE